MTLTAVAVVQMYANPIRVRLSATSTVLTQRDVKVTRIHSNGDRWPVLLPPDSKLIGGVWAGFDYHAPIDQSVKYEINAGVETATTASVFRVGKSVMLQHPSNPDLSLTALFIPEGGLGDPDFSTSAGVFDIVGSDTPVSVTDETIRRSSSIQLAFTPAQCAAGGAVEKLLRNGGPLLLNVPVTLGWDISWTWIQRQGTSIKNPGKRANGGNAAYPFRILEMSYVIVNQPFASQRSNWDFKTLASSFASFDAAKAAFADFQAMALNERTG